jgi:hypothetical protein
MPVEPREAGRWKRERQNPEKTPSAVPERAPQDGEIRARWAWVETEVWTERMLATLETGIEGGNLLLRIGLVLLKTSLLPCGTPTFMKVNHQLESWVREIRLPSSEGGAT